MKFWMLCASLILAGIGLLAVQPATAWRDASPHRTRFVTVDSSVLLEVLGWGGSGRPIVWLGWAQVSICFCPMRLTSFAK